MWKNKSERKNAENFDFVYHLKISDGIKDMGPCWQSQIILKMPLELLLHLLCIVLEKKLILNKYQNYRKKICRFHEAFIFKVLVYYSILKFHVRDYLRIYKLDWILPDF